ncbi:MAG: STAS domain-containing protein [Deltaproteobacteria bacterium]|nr:STAS domain-containing protein [Deltaproteobacteria bacterium]
MQTVQLNDTLVITNIANCKKRILTALKDAMQQNQSEIVIKLDQVSDCDSSGVQLLMAAQKQGFKENIKVSFDNYSESVMRAFQTVGIDDVNEYFHDSSEVSQWAKQ